MLLRFFLTVISALIFLLFSFFVAFGAESENNHFYPELVNTKVDANIRLKPAYNAIRIGHFKKGERVVVTRVLGQWCQVLYKNYQNAYVYCPLLTNIELLKKYSFVFYEGDKYSIVALGGMKIAYIDRKGNIIHYAYNFDNGPDYFQEGLSRYVENGKVGFINEDLKIVIPAQFDWASYFENGVAKICNGCKKISDGEYSQMEGGIWGTLDKNGVATWDKE